MLAIEVVLLFIAVTFAHVSALALSAKLARVPVRQVQYGIAPVIATFGKYRLGFLPVGGFVKMKDSREDSLDADSLEDAFDHQPRWIQAAMPLGGSLLVLLVAIALLGREGWTAFASGFGQIVHGAISPLNEAQHLLASFVAYLEVRSLPDSVGLFFAKMAAFNLLPIPILNGGDAIANLLGIYRASERVRMRVQQVSLCFVLPLWIGWLCAAVVYVARATNLID